MMLAMNKKERVILIGASSNPERYAYMALQLLADLGHHVFPVNPKETEILGHKVYGELSEIRGAIDTVSMYIGPEKSMRLKAPLCDMKPRRVIFNPGAENPALADILRAEGVFCIDACTLVLLKTDQF
jgi:uncharacterized protein